MGSGFPFFDIIFFAMVAAFILLRLRSVLGRRTGHEKPRDFEGVFGAPTEPVENNLDSTDNAVLPESKNEEKRRYGEVFKNSRISAEAEKNLESVAAHDPSFSTDDFFIGATLAFETIVTAYAAGDRKTLKPLVAKTVYDSFETGIKQREKAGEKMETTLIGLDKIDLTEVKVDDNGRAEITVKFQSQQVNILRDKDDRIVDGDREYVEDVIDLWVFARDLVSSDPNWVLVATLNPQ